MFCYFLITIAFNKLYVTLLCHAMIESMAAAHVRFLSYMCSFMQRRQVCMDMGVVIVSQWHCSRRGTDSCAHRHGSLNVKAVTHVIKACLHAQDLIKHCHTFQYS